MLKYYAFILCKLFSSVFSETEISFESLLSVFDSSHFYISDILYNW